MKRWIVTLSALLVGASAFAGGGKNTYTGCNPTQPIICDPKPPINVPICDPKQPTNCNPNPPSNCVPEPTSVAAMAIGGLFFIKRKKKTQA